LLFIDEINPASKEQAVVSNYFVVHLDKYLCNREKGRYDGVHPTKKKE